MNWKGNDTCHFRKRRLTGDRPEIGHRTCRNGLGRSRVGGARVAVDRKRVARFYGADNARTQHRRSGHTSRRAYEKYIYEQRIYTAHHYYYY